MLYNSIWDFIAAKDKCPICLKKVSLGIEQRDGVCTIKINKYDKDIIIQIDRDGKIKYSSSIDLAAKRYVTSKLLTQKKLNSVTSSCLSRVPIKNEDATIISTHSEYYALWNVVLNKTNDALIGIDVTHEIFRLTELDELHELVVNYDTDNVSVTTRESLGRTTLYIPASFIKIDKNTNRDYLLRKIHTILLMKN